MTGVLSDVASELGKGVYPGMRRKLDKEEAFVGEQLDEQVVVVPQ